MLAFLMSLPDILLFLVLSGFFIGISLISVTILRRRYVGFFHYRDNAVLGNVAGLIGIIYGVLAGLTALYLINNVTAAETSVQQEANAAANLFRDTTWVQGPAKVKIQKQIGEYLKLVIISEWPMMSKGLKVEENGEAIIENIVDEILKVNFVGVNEAMIGRDMLQETKALYNARQMRISLSYSQLSSAIWQVILVGTFLTLGINYLFKLTYYMHLVSVSAAGLMAASMIYLLITLDKPFQGDFVIGPDALQNVLRLTETKSNPPNLSSPTGQSKILNSSLMS